MRWFRMYADAVDDEKLRLLAFEDRWHFVAILCLKANGTLDSDAPFLERRIAVKLGVQLRELDEIKRRLEEVGLIDNRWQPIAWDKRQFQSDHNGAERVRRWRERQKQLANGDVTLQERHSNALEQIQIQIQNRTDTESEKRRAKRGSRRVPEDFQPDLDFARREISDIDAEAEAAKFRDYEFARPRRDWEATWRNWIRTCKATGKYAKAKGGDGGWI